MTDLYTEIFLVDILILIITIFDAVTNRILSKHMINSTIYACLLIAAALICEYIGVIINGASQTFITLHKAAKLAEFCFAPAIGACVAIAYGYVRKPKSAIAAVIAHAAFECISSCFNLVFSVDSQNINHHEILYPVYACVLILSAVYCFVCIVRNRKRTQTGMDNALILTLIMITFGIGIQQFINCNIKINYLCIAVGNMLLYNRSNKLILQLDSVTELLNRRCYDTNIGNLDRNVIIILFDINRFKKINDTYGHSTGDVCLKRVADEIRKIYGRYGDCYRIGGDEFCVILRSNFNDLSKMNNQFTNSIEIMCREDKKMASIALGYAYYNPETSHIQNTVEEADAMMYKNKNLMKRE